MVRAEEKAGPEDVGEQALMRGLDRHQSCRGEGGTTVRYFLPRDLRMACFHLIRQMPARLGNDLNPALDKPLPLPIGFELLERYILQHAMNAFNRLDDVCQTRNKRPGYH